MTEAARITKSHKYRAYSYTYLLMAVHKSIRRAQNSERDTFVDCLNVLLYSALAAEAFLNHIGPQVFPHWEPLKKKLSPQEKLDVIAAAKGVKFSWGAEPYQSLAEVIRFRNLVAHAETTDVDYTVLSDGRVVSSHWQSYCQLDVAERISASIEALIKTLPKELGVIVPQANTLAAQISKVT